MNNNNKPPQGYSTFPYLYDFVKRGIPKSKTPKVVAMKKLINKNNNDY